MRSMVSLAVLVVAGGAFAGYLVARHHVVAAASADGGAAHQAGVDGLAAYHAGKFAEAIPLLKKYAESAEVRGDKEKQKQILMAIVDAEGKVAPASPAASAPVSGQGVVAAEGDLDPTTGKPRIPHAAPKAGEVLTMGIRELGNFEFDPTTTKDIPADVKGLDGATVRLRGFMIPLNQAEDITDFALVPTLANCCFGQPPGVQHTITCKTEKGRAVQYTVDEISVTGKLSVKMKRDQDYTYEIFGMVVSSVKVAE